MLQMLSVTVIFRLPGGIALFSIRKVVSRARVGMAYRWKIASFV